MENQVGHELPIKEHQVHMPSYARMVKASILVKQKTSERESRSTKSKSNTRTTNIYMLDIYMYLKNLSLQSVSSRGNPEGILHDYTFCSVYMSLSTLVFRKPKLAHFIRGLHLLCTLVFEI